MLDDFRPQPYQGQSIYYYNRLDGDRGAINESDLDWGVGEVTMTVTAGKSWGGVWMSLNHPATESLPIDFSAILPSQISSAYQSQMTGIEVRIVRGTPGRRFRMELKNGDSLPWSREFNLTGGPQIASYTLPALDNITQFVWVLDSAVASDYVVVDKVSFTASTKITDTAMAVFVWSYGMLLSNQDESYGLVRDKAKDLSGAFDAIQSTGSLAAATAIAAQFGVIEQAEAVKVVNKISNTLLSPDFPKFHGLWPHWITTTVTGTITIHPDSEWSSVDTAIAAIGLLDAQIALGLDPSGTEQFLRSIDWTDLQLEGGISHGYTYTEAKIPYSWDTFGGESWLVELVAAGATGKLGPIAYPTPPTANGSGFIDELAWLYTLPPSVPDNWGTDWDSYRMAATFTHLRMNG
jgi:hypothetical protein